MFYPSAKLEPAIDFEIIRKENQWYQQFSKLSY